jgi:flagellar M-ring protein FliF
LISKSVKNMPEKNVAVIDSNFNYLSENIDNSDISSQTALTNRYETQSQFNSKIENDLKTMLEAVFGPNKVKVNVNADLDFDSKETTSIKYDTQSIIKNQHTIKESVVNGAVVSTGSPVDNQLSNTTKVDNSNPSSLKEDNTINYDIGQVEEKTIRAPGQVRKISTSVVVDGTLSPAVKASINNIVTSAIGFDANRGDLITVEGMPFDNTAQKLAAADLADIQNQQKIADRNKKLFTYIGYSAAGILGFLILLFLISKIRSGFRKPLTAGGLDVIIDQPIAINEIISKQSILDVEEENNDLTSELKKYASKKPEQVVEIIKSWLAEDER